MTNAETYEVYLVHDGHGGEGHEVLEGVPHQLQREQEGERLVRLPEHRRVPAHATPQRINYIEESQELEFLNNLWGLGTE